MSVKPPREEGGTNVARAKEIEKEKENGNEKEQEKANGKENDRGNINAT